MNLKQLQQVSLAVKSLTDAEPFYTDTLGLELVDDFGSFFIVRSGSTDLMITEGDQPNSVIYFEPEDGIDAAFADIECSGAEIVEAPHCIAKDWKGVDVWLAFFKDPSGNLLALKSHVPNAK
jgi:catechol 2,3-dioxygenase-like lactoylglutathione lyase family enzyme